MFVRVLQQNRASIHTLRHIHTDKELAHTVVGISKSEICRACRQSGNPGKSECCSLDSKFRGSRLEARAGFLCCSLEAEFLLHWGASAMALEVFNWLGEAHLIAESNLLYFKSTDCELIISTNTFTATSRPVFDQTTGHHDIVKWTHKINHHRAIFKVTSNEVICRKGLSKIRRDAQTLVFK